MQKILKAVVGLSVLGVCFILYAIPTRITNILVTVAGSTSLTFQWTEAAPTAGFTLVSNDVRISTAPITTLNFLSASNISLLVGNPGNPGTVQSATIGGLTQITRYYIAMRTLDSSGGWSHVSNPGTAVTSANNGVTLAWDLNPDPQVAGYILHWGTASGVYSFTKTVDPSTSSTAVDNLVNGVTYFFALTVFDVSGFEFDTSNEISYTVPMPGS